MRRVLLAILACAATACAPGLGLESEWQPAGRQAAPFRNLLVVGVSESFERRRFFEEAVVADLVAAGVRATASTSRMTTRDPLNRDTVAAVVANLGNDAVLVTRIVNQTVALRERPGREQLKGGNPANATIESFDPAAYTLYGYDYATEAEPDQLIVNREAGVRAELFAVASGQVAYAIDARVQLDETASRSFGTDVALLDRVGRALGARLRRDGAVKVP